MYGLPTVLLLSYYKWKKRQGMPYIAGAKPKGVPFIKIYDLKDLKEVDR